MPIAAELLQNLEQAEEVILFYILFLFYPASKRMGIFQRRRTASLEDTPKKLTKGEKRVAPSPPGERIPKKGKGSTSHSYAAATRGQTPQEDGEWQLVETKKNKKKKGREVSAQEPKEKKKVPLRSPAASSGEAIRVSAKNSESYAEILKAMKAKVNPQNSGAEVLSIWITRRRSSWS